MDRRDLLGLPGSGAAGIASGIAGVDQIAAGRSALDALGIEILTACSATARARGTPTPGR